jgi:hypothetical protein
MFTPRSRADRMLRALAVVIVCAAGVAAAVALLRAPAGVISTDRTTAPAAATGAGPTATTTTTTAASPPSRAPLESMFQDDRELIYGSTATVTRTLSLLRSLGVDRLRLTILWADIAPAPDATTRPPGFEATDPAAYPTAAWRPYDRVVRLARARGIGVDFDVSAPGPRWAMTPGAPEASQANHYEPSAAEFGQFVRALGRRYSGRYVARGAGTPLPRVSYWSIWNEPNQPGWLAPQTVAAAGERVIASARLDRGYIDAGVAALGASGHRADTILIGELAPEGDTRSGPSLPVAPLPFLRALYCVDGAYRPLTGAAARLLACPDGGSRAAFVTANPGLFDATGFAHHPYSFFLAPDASMSDADFAPLADLSRLERALDRSVAAYGVTRRLPIYLTEYGYETNPPNPYRGVTPATQAAYLDEAEYLAWRDPRVRTLSQFLLRDSAPDRAYRRGSVRYWSTFQTGLEYLNGRPKPALSSYRLPIVVLPGTSAPGGSVTVWGMLRAAPDGTRQRARIQWRARSGHGAFRTLRTVWTSDPVGVFTARVRPPGAGSLQIAWTTAGGATIDSRLAAVR